MKATEPKAVLLKDYRPPSHLIDKVSLVARLHPTATEVTCKIEVRPNPALPAKDTRDLKLDGEKIELQRLRLDGADVPASRMRITPIDLTLVGTPARPFTLEIVTTCNPQDNSELSGLYLSKGIYCTQCEAEGFRRITYFMDRPDVLARYTTRIEADRDEAPILLGNGNPSERGTLDGGRRHYAVWKDPYPKPSYLFAMVGGNLAPFGSSFTTKSGRQVDLRIYVEPGKEDRCAWAMDALKRSMRWDEERFGCEYDLDVFNIVAVSDFNMGAMENKGLNIFNDRLILATAKTATDQNYADIERVIAHEYFHNWTGNRITCRDWFQLCLKEGLTVYRDQKFAADMRSRAVQRITEVRNLRARQFSEDAGPLAHPVRPDSYVEINNFYTATVYDKGAEICRMIATLLGADAFRRGMDLYLTRHDGEAATVEQFVACFEEVSGRDLSQFMLWYSEAGTPRVVCNVSHDPAKAILTVDLEQVLPPTPGQAKKKPKHIPLRIGLISADGREIAATAMDAGADVRDGLVELRRRREKIRFRDVTEAPLVSINRGFSAPVVVVMNQSARDLADLIRNDSDPFNRWQAAQTLACDLMVQWTSDLKAGRRPSAAPDYTRAVAHVVSDEKLDTAFRAAMATLPSEADVARALEKDIDPDAIYRARLHLRKQLAAGLGGGLHDLRRRHEVRGRYAPDQKQSGARALRNTLLNLMAARGRAEDLAALEQQFRDAQNATDEIAAFALLAYCAGPRRTAALERYFGKWHAEPLMIDHWFTVQAAAPRTGGLVAVKRLTKHPLYSWRNPNKVRSLLFAFASLNLLGFNRPDGQGYDFIASCVARLDAINPQMAARLLGVFRSWPTLEAGRRAKAKSALEHLVKRPGLSRDVSEILAKMLDA